MREDSVVAEQSDPKMLETDTAEARPGRDGRGPQRRQGEPRCFGSVGAVLPTLCSSQSGYQGRP